MTTGPRRRARTGRPLLPDSRTQENSGYLTGTDPLSISGLDPSVHVLASRFFAGRELGPAADGFTKRLEGVYPPWVHALLHVTAEPQPQEARREGPDPAPIS